MNIKINPDGIRAVLIQKLYKYLSGETFLYKGYPPNPLPKTLIMI